MNFNKLIFSTLLLIICSTGFSQTIFDWKDNRNFYEVDGRLGKYFPFEERHAYMKQLPQYGLDLRIGRQTDGRNQWERSFNYLSYGIFARIEKNNVDSIKYTTRNEDGYAFDQWVALGDCYSVGGFINGHIVRGKYWSLDYDLMGGLSFWTHHGDEFIGSVTNVHLAIDAGPTFMMNDNFDFLVRYQFSHSSNAALALPNCGINVLSWLVGLRYHPQGHPVLLPKTPYEFHKTTSLFATEAFGIVQTNESMRSYETPSGEMIGDLPQERPYYFADMIQLGVHRQFHPKFSYDVALDLSWTGETKRKYDKALQNYNDNPDGFNLPLVEYSFMRGTHAALSAMFEVNYNKFAFCIGGAYYLWHGIYYGTDETKTWALPESSRSPFESQYLPPCYRTYYERLGFKYYFGENNRFHVGYFMKVHQVVIDYAEFTIGMDLFKWEGKKTHIHR